MDDREFHDLLNAVERGEPLPADLPADDAADLAAAQSLFAGRRELPTPMAGREWREEAVTDKSLPATGGDGSSRRGPRQLFGRRWLPELALLALITALGAVVWVGARQLTPAQGSETPEAPVGDGTPGASIEPFGRLVYAEHVEVDGDDHMLVKVADLATGELVADLTRFVSPAPVMSAWALSPDGAWLAGAEGEVVLMDVGGQFSDRVGALPGTGLTRVEGMSWAPDRRSAVYTPDGNALYFGTAYFPPDSAYPTSVGRQYDEFTVQRVTGIPFGEPDSQPQLQTEEILRLTSAELEGRYPRLVGMNEEANVAVIALGYLPNYCCTEKLVIYDLSSGKQGSSIDVVHQVGDTDPYPHAASASPDSRWVAFSEARPEDPDHPVIRVLNLTSMETQDVVKSDQGSDSPSRFLWSTDSSWLAWNEEDVNYGSFGIQAARLVDETLSDERWEPVASPTADFVEGEKPHADAFAPAGRPILLGDRLYHLGAGSHAPLPEPAARILGQANTEVIAWAPGPLAPTPTAPPLDFSQVTPPTPDPIETLPTPGPTDTAFPISTPTATPISALSTLPVGGPLPGGRYSAITVAGDLAYVVVDDRLAVLNVADPANPSMIGESEPLRLRGALEMPQSADIAVVRNHAYIATFSDGPGHTVQVVDVANPSAPHAVELVLEGDPESGPLASQRLTADGERLYADAAGATLDPDRGAPFFPRPRAFEVRPDGSLKQLPFDSTDLVALAPFGNRLFALGESGLMGFKRVDPKTSSGTPEPVRFERESFNVDDFWESRSTAHGRLVTGESLLWGLLVDRSLMCEGVMHCDSIFLQQPGGARLGHWPLDDELTAMAAGEDTLFVATLPIYNQQAYPGSDLPEPRTTLWVLDARDGRRPRAPVEITELPGPVSGLAFHAGYLYASTDDGLAVLDVRDPLQAKFPRLPPTPPKPPIAPSPNP